jgi:3',5'-cyclic-AMP phosphodiesterase
VDHHGEVSDATILVQITDCHLGPPGERPYGIDTAANLARVLADVASMDPPADAILLTGDLSDTGCEASYRLLAALLDEHLGSLPVPTLAVVGNHDHRETFRKVILGEADPDDATPHHYVHDLERVRVVMCDSYAAGKVTGALGPVQLAWLDDVLATSDGDERPVVVALHHPSVPRGIPKADDYLLEDRDAFGEVLARHRVAVVLVGHSHVPTAASFGGTTHVAAPSAGYAMDPFSFQGSTRNPAVIGYSICTVRDGRAVVNPHLLVP